ELLVGRQGEPELESAGPARVAGTAAMPCTAGGLEPFDPASGQEPGGAGRVFLADAAFPKIGERRDARMRMPPDARKRPSLGVEEVEKDERLESLTEVRRAHQTGDGPLMQAARPMDRLTSALSDHCSGFSYD